MLYASGWRPSLGLVGFMLWAVSPYVAVAAVLRALGNRTSASRVASVAASTAVLGFASLMYVDAVFIHVSSTSALIFLFGPLYLTAGGVILFMTIILIGNRTFAGRDT
jgi:hypothetical protein